ncbi:MAG: glycine zipper 2TM domain-containing protein [Alphaproteobacteria bacterium]|nr:glycine zipper 2TM domain-containing protein [Alphaproteobacteria bacterium]
MPQERSGGVILLLRFVKFGLFAVVFAVAGCAPAYSPNVYSGDAVQQANKVERGTVIGFRQVEIQSDGTVGAVAGGAAGGVLGSQAGDDTVARALGAVGGAVVGGLVGTTVEHTTGDTTGWEYIVSETNGDLVSVTQRQPQPIAVGQHVLVIAGKQARIVPDYSIASAPSAASTANNKTAAPGTAPAAAAAPTPITPASNTAAPASTANSATPAAAPPPPVPASAFVAATPPSEPQPASSAASAPSPAPADNGGNAAAPTPPAQQQSEFNR